MIDLEFGGDPQALLYEQPFGPLATPREILARAGASDPADHDARALRALAAMARYVTEFLTAGHAELGRPGAVCPFAAKALERSLIRLTAFSEVDETTVTLGMTRLKSTLMELDDGLAVQGRRHRAIVAVFPGLSEPAGAAMIERIQKALKPSFIDQGLMIGQFYPSCPAPGLWNPGFRPLQAPVVSLAVRNITIFDAPFMLDRPEHMQAFVRVFGRAGERGLENALNERSLNERAGQGADVVEARP